LKHPLFLLILFCRSELLLCSRKMDSTVVALAITSGVTYLLNYLVLTYACFISDYPPLMVKNFNLVYAAFFTCLYWWIGILHASGVHTYAGVWRVCSLWGVWVHYVLGLMGFYLIIILRLHGLHKVYVRRKQVMNFKDLLRPFVLYSLPLLAIGIFSSAAGSLGVIFDETTSTCVYSEGFKIVLSYLPLVGQVILTIYIFLLKDIMETFGEFRDQSIGMLLLYVNLCVQTIVIPFNFQESLWGFCLLLFSNLICCNIYIWGTIGQPFFGYLLRRNECLLDFNSVVEEKIRVMNKRKKDNNRV